MAEYCQFILLRPENDMECEMSDDVFVELLKLVDESPGKLRSTESTSDNSLFSLKNVNKFSLRQLPKNNSCDDCVMPRYPIFVYPAKRLFNLNLSSIVCFRRKC